MHQLGCKETINTKGGSLNLVTLSSAKNVLNYDPEISKTKLLKKLLADKAFYPLSHLNFSIRSARRRMMKSGKQKTAASHTFWFAVRFVLFLSWIACVGIRCKEENSKKTLFRLEFFTATSNIKLVSVFVLSCLLLHSFSFVFKKADFFFRSPNNRYWRITLGNCFVFFSFHRRVSSCFCSFQPMVTGNCHAENTYTLHHRRKNPKSRAWWEFFCSVDRRVRKVFSLAFKTNCTFERVLHLSAYERIITIMRSLRWTLNVLTAFYCGICFLLTKIDWAA